MNLTKIVLNILPKKGIIKLYWIIRSKIMVCFDDIRKSKAIKAYIDAADASLSALGYTEHSTAHVTKVADDAAMILSSLGFDERTVELVRIAAYLHDIGNLVNRDDHSQSGAIMAFRILNELGMDPTEIATVVTAIGNHDESTGVAVNPVAAALIIADKADVRRTRVRNRDFSTFDIHDRVNYSVFETSLDVDVEAREVRLAIKIDTEISSIMDYFEIFLGRMIMCRGSAQALGLAFRFTINEQNFI